MLAEMSKRSLMAGFLNDLTHDMHVHICTDAKGCGEDQALQEILS